jgi:hypothetical protein
LTAANVALRRELPDPDRVRWLETLAAACERILGRDDVDPTDWSRSPVRHDVEELLSRVQAELNEPR